MTLRTGSIYAALGSLAALAGCLVTNQNHCALNEGACGEGMACSMCAADNNGCVPLGSPMGDGCLFASGTTDGPSSNTEPPPTTETTPGTETSVDPPTTSTDGPTTIDPTTETTQSSLDTTETTETTGPGPCTGDVIDNPMCGADEPYCVDGVCVGCGKLDCAVVEEGKPACEPMSGRCVECQMDSDCSTDQKPACDLLTATCGACTSHAQCPTTACNLETGECFPEDNVIFVANGKPCDEGGTGETMEVPLCSLAKALTLVSPNEPTTIKIKATSTAQKDPAVVPPGDITVAIVHYGATLPTLAIESPDPALTLQPGNKVFMHRIGISNPNGAVSHPAILCVDAVLWLDRQRIFDVRSAISANNCRVHIRQTTITAQTVGGLDLFGTDLAKAQLWVENSYFTSFTGTSFGAMRLGGTVQAELLYTTVALVKSPQPPIQCVNNFSGTLTVRNSALIAPGDRIGAGCAGKVTIDDTTYQSTEDTQAQLAGTFASFSEGRLQAKEGGPLKDKAVWLAGDPLVDHDGTPRPTEEPFLDYAGADRPVK